MLRAGPWQLLDERTFPGPPYVLAPARTSPGPRRREVVRLRGVRRGGSGSGLLGEIGVRVNAILPGLVDGPRGQRVMREQAEQRGMTLEEWMPFFLHNISMHTAIDMKEIADVAVFLASDLAPHISGQSISVCGNFESYRGPRT